MLDLRYSTYEAPPVADVIAQFRNDGSLPPVVTVENLSDRFDTPASVSLKYQESADGTTWVDVAGTSVIIAPGASNTQVLTAATERFIAIFAGGSAKVLVTIQRQVNGSPLDLGSVG
jgi:hypothetical protein